MLFHSPGRSSCDLDVHAARQRHRNSCEDILSNSATNTGRECASGIAEVVRLSQKL